MSVTGIDHVVIVANDIDESIDTWQKIGLTLSHRVDLGSAGMQQAFFSLDDDTFIEVLAPSHEQSPISKTLTDRGEGMHVMALEVDDLKLTVEELQSKGVELIGVGTDQVFIHPKSANGIMIQLWPKDRPHKWKANPSEQEAITKE